MDSVSFIRERLFSMKDDDYAAFHGKLIPNIDKSRIIGVRTPLLRSFAKEIAKTDTALDFINSLPHEYYEENNLHAFLLEMSKDYDRLIFELDRFLPYVDNWATCDAMSPKVFAKNTDKLITKIDEWIKSDKTYTVRFAIEMLMKYYLDDNFSVDYLERVAAVRSDEYYINMMIAWYFATALAKQYDSAVVYIEKHRLSDRSNNKAIQKAVESYRITPEQKTYLRTLKVK